ncbi:hypothetical protein B0H11DRAFT_314441 [Mycena galericulata]|nr:hypothetical protein B0H11DRAFT_314441 [Mycena galericulata]
MSIPKCEVCNDCGPDVILEASNGTRFGVSATNLHRFSGAFPAPGFVNEDSAPANEVVILPETADVVRLMVQFIHPGVRQPDIWRIGNLWQLAEAVEKYMIFPAQGVVKARVRTLATENPIQVFIYAARHGHDDLLPDVQKPIGLTDYKSIEIPLQLLYAEPPWVIGAFHAYGVFKLPSSAPLHLTRTILFCRFRERYRENALRMALKLRDLKEPRDRMYTHPNSAGTDICGWDKCAGKGLTAGTVERQSGM